MAEAIFRLRPVAQGLHRPADRRRRCAPGRTHTIDVMAQSGGSPGPIPFAEFIAATREASLPQLQRAPHCRVRDAPAFAEMRAHVLERYRGMAVTRSLLVGGHTFDCVAAAGAEAAPPGTTSGCPPGTIPMRRMTLEEMVRFETLRDFLRKGSGRGAPPGD